MYARPALDPPCWRCISSASSRADVDATLPPGRRLPMSGGSGRRRHSDVGGRHRPPTCSSSGGPLSDSRAARRSPRASSPPPASARRGAGASLCRGPPLTGAPRRGAPRPRGLLGEAFGCVVLRAACRGLRTPTSKRRASEEKLPAPSRLLVLWEGPDSWGAREVRHGCSCPGWGPKARHAIGRAMRCCSLNGQAIRVALDLMQDLCDTGRDEM